MRARAIKLYQTASWRGPLLVAVLSLCIPPLGCFVEDPPRTVQADPSKVSREVHLVEESAHPQTPVQPLANGFEEKTSLKRRPFAGQHEVVGGSMGTDQAFSDLTNAPAAEQFFVDPALDTAPRVVDASSGAWNPSGVSGFVTGEGPSHKKRLAGSASDLAAFGYAYQAAFFSLFNRSFADQDLLSQARMDGRFDDSSFPGEDLLGDHNPFEEALNSQEAADVQQAAEIVPEPAPQQAPPPPAEPQVLPSLREPTGPFDLLVLAEPVPGSPRRVFRATREDDELILDNLSAVSPGNAFLKFEKGELVMTSYLDDDGLADLVVVKHLGSGSLVDVFLASGGIRFDRDTSFSVPYIVEGVSEFEMTGDGADDLIFLVQENPFLVIYEAVEDGFKYLQDLALPFHPRLLVASALTGGSPALHAFDSSLTRGVSFGLGDAGTFTETMNPVLDSFEVFSMEASPAGEDLVILDYGGRVTLIHRTSDDTRFLGGFSVAGEVPLVIFGDYSRSGSQQIIFRP